MSDDGDMLVKVLARVLERLIDINVKVKFLSISAPNINWNIFLTLFFLFNTFYSRKRPYKVELFK